MKIFKTLLVSSLLLSSVFAHADSNELATGATAEKLWNWIQSREFDIDPGVQNSTRVKILNMTNPSNYRLDRGERGILCNKFADPQTIKEMGTVYYCRLLDMPEIK